MECSGCGADATLQQYEQFENIQHREFPWDEQWREGNHCNGCLRTYWGAPEQPLVCTACYDALESGEAAWVKEAPWRESGSTA